MPRPGRTRRPDPWTAADQAEFRANLRALISWAGHGSLQQLETAALRCGTSMPVSTANRALNNDRLPTAEFVERVAISCGVDEKQWVAARDALADRPYLRKARSASAMEFVEICPYPGLAAFTADQVQWFFGREKVTADLLDLLAGATGPVIVSGPSGTGKSSLLRAGLLPALAAGRLPGSASWTCVAITPTDGLTECLATKPDLIVVDQFEEIFTLWHDESRRQSFVDALCAHDRVVLGMRADFHGHCASYPELVDALRRGQVLLAPMTEEQLRAAMEKPAAAAGLELQSGLADVMLGDLGECDQPGVLPLLAHTLMATWRHRTGRVLTIAGYRLTGGVAGAIAKTAERTYQQLDAEQQDLARVLLLRMIQLGDGTTDTRKHLERSQLPAPAADPVLTALIDARLVTADRSTVMLAHEAILRAWPRLRGWINADRARLLAEQRLVTAAEAWDRDGRHESDLYRGHRLAAVVEEPPAAAAEFVRASVERARTETRAATRRARRLRQLVAVLSCLVLLAAVMTAITIVSRQDIAAQRDIGVSRQVASVAIALRSSEPDLAGQLALAAFDLAETAEARGAVMTTLVNLDPARRTDVSSTEAVQTVAFSGDGTYMTAASRDGYARVWPLGQPASLTTSFELAKHPGQVRSARFGAGDRYLATSGGDGKVRVWSTKDLEPGAEPRFSVAGPSGDLGPLAFSGDGTLLVTGARAGHGVSVWNLADPATAVATFGDHRRDVEAVAFTATGRLLATSARDGSVKLWDLTNPATPVELWADPLNEGPVHALAFGEADTLLVAGTDASTAVVWDVTDPRRRQRLSTITGHLGRVFDVAFQPGGHLLATATIDTVARIWDLSDPRNPVSWATPLVGDADNVYSVAFHPDGHTLATASHGQAIRLWETDIARASAQICALADPQITRAQWTKYLPDYAYTPPCASRPAPKQVAATGSTELVAQHSGKCLASRTTTTASGTPVLQFRCEHLRTGRWTFHEVGDRYQVRNTATHRCLDSRSDERKSGGAYLVVQRTCDADTQLWRVEEVGRTKDHVDIQLVHEASGQCLDINQAIILDGGQAIRWTCGSSPNQVFRVTPNVI